MIFYLFPFAWFKFRVLGILRKIFPWLAANRRSIRHIDISETILDYNNTFIVPWQIKLLWFTMCIIGLIALTKIFLQVRRYFKLKRIFSRGHTGNGLHKLLEELKDMNFISESDIKNQLGHPLPPFKFIIASGDQLETLLSKSQDERNYLKRLEIEQKHFQYMMDAFDSGNYAVDQYADVNELRKFYETQIEQNQKIQDIISQLKR